MSDPVCVALLINVVVAFALGAHPDARSAILIVSGLLLAAWAGWRVRRMHAGGPLAAMLAGLSVPGTFIVLGGCLWLAMQLVVSLDPNSQLAGLTAPEAPQPLSMGLAVVTSVFFGWLGSRVGHGAR